MKKLLFLITFYSMAFMPVENVVIKGTINHSGTPIKDIDVSLRKVPGNEIVKTVKTDEKGQFVLDEIPSGTYELVIQGITITAENNQVSGRISIGGEWLKKADVYFYNEEKVQVAATLTDNRGNFLFEGLPAGNISIVVVAGEIRQ